MSNSKHIYNVQIDEYVIDIKLKVLGMIEIQPTNQYNCLEVRFKPMETKKMASVK